MPRNDPAGYLPNVRKNRVDSASDGAAVKSPMYKGKSKSRTVSGESDIQRPFPVGGKGPKKTPAKGGGYGPGGRFGRGGWQAKARRAGINFGKTPEQEAESKRKQMMMEAKRRSAKTRLSATKKGPNEKQSQLLGGE